MEEINKHKIMLISQTNSPMLNNILKVMEGYFEIKTNNSIDNKKDKKKKEKKIYYQGRNFRLVA